MMRLPVVFALLSLVAAPAAMAQMSEAEACMYFTEAAKIASGSLPYKISDTITQETASVACDTKTFDSGIVISKPFPEMPPDWQETEQKRLNEAYCSDPAALDVFSRGWAIAETTRFADGVTMTIRVKCE
jgi:hypothetical protein